MLSILHHAAGLYHSFSHLRHTWQDAHDEMTSTIFNRAIETVEHLRLKLPEHLAKPRVAIVCGSGLGGLAQTVNEGEKKMEWDYKDVTNFPLSTGMWDRTEDEDDIGSVLILISTAVPGHEGRLIFGTMGPRRVPVVLLVGRAQSVASLDSPMNAISERLLISLLSQFL